MGVFRITWWTLEICPRSDDRGWRDETIRLLMERNETEVRQTQKSLTPFLLVQISFFAYHTVCISSEMQVRKRVQSAMFRAYVYLCSLHPWERLSIRSAIYLLVNHAPNYSNNLTDMKTRQIIGEKLVSRPCHLTTCTQRQRLLAQNCLRIWRIWMEHKKYKAEVESPVHTTVRIEGGTVMMNSQ